MSMRDLVDADCGGANALMRLGSHFSRDVARKDDGISRGAAGSSFVPQIPGQEPGADQLVNEFLGGPMGPIHPPQTFRMDALLEEMRQIDAQNYHAQLQRAPPVIEEVNNIGAAAWTNEFFAQASAATAGPKPSELSAAGPSQMMMMETSNAPPVPYHPEQMKHYHQMQTKDFFQSDVPANLIPPAAGAVLRSVGHDSDQFRYSEFMHFMQNVNEGQIKLDQGHVAMAEDFFAAHDAAASVAAIPSTSSANQSASASTEAALKTEDVDSKVDQDTTPDWVRDFQASEQSELEKNQDFNAEFWNRLQNEWMKLSEDQSGAHPWLFEFTDYFDPYKEYKFDEENPMLNIENAFERGKTFLQNGDLPSAVYCFESAVKQDPDNAEIWQLLGISQAENEKDPNAICALKKSLEIQPNNPKAMMALAVSYTNESMQGQALNMLTSWLRIHPKYRHLVPASFSGAREKENASAMSGTVVHGPEMKEVQELFLRAVHLNQPEIDGDIQEALGVLFNLSSEYDKAADCFRTALHVRPDSAKTWNRLGASLANGNRSVEAVEAYQRALEIEPGFIRARYNVGIICINLKAFKEATEHFLTALNHQASSMVRAGLSDGSPSSQMSDTIWGTMRMAVTLMGRSDLMPALDNRNLAALNEAFQPADMPY